MKVRNFEKQRHENGYVAQTSIKMVGRTCKVFISTSTNSDRAHKTLTKDELEGRDGSLLLRHLEYLGGGDGGWRRRESYPRTLG